MLTEKMLILNKNDEFLEPVSAMEANSLQILVNSAEGKVTMELYSVSGIPNCSLSKDKRLRLNSETLSWTR